MLQVIPFPENPSTRLVNLTLILTFWSPKDKRFIHLFSIDLGIDWRSFK